MSQTAKLKRLSEDVTGVLRTADPLSSAKWLAGIALRLSEIAKTGQLAPADAFVGNRPGRFKTHTGQTVLLPPQSFGGAREMYCREVYLRTGLEIRPNTDVVDLGANHGLFAVRAAVMGARALAVEAQPGFVHDITALAELNGVSDRVSIETALVGPSNANMNPVGALLDEGRWESATHSWGATPVQRPMADILKAHAIEDVSLLKMDIEGGEFALINTDEDCSWLTRVDQIAGELHPPYGSVPDLVNIIVDNGFQVELQDNDGHASTAGDPAVTYLYARRPHQHGSGVH